MTLELWGVLGTWFAGFGTLMAALVALWLGLRKTTIRLVAMARPDTESRNCFIDITNRGHAAVAFEAVSWSVVKSRQRQHFSLLRSYLALTMHEQF